MIESRSFPVLEMSCVSCAASIESFLNERTGVQEARVNYANQTALIVWDDSLISIDQIHQDIIDLGYDILLETENAASDFEKQQQAAFRRLKHNTWWAGILTIPVFILGMFFMEQWFTPWISLLFSIPVLFYFGRHFYVSAWKKLLKRTSTMDTLVALSTSIAFSFSVFNTVYPHFWHQRGLHPHVYYEAATVIIVFISIGKLLEERAKLNTGTALKKLLGLQPKEVLVLESDGTEKWLSIDLLKKGMCVRVNPGMNIPVDGKIVRGTSSVSESTISGEPIPVEKNAGDQVFAGTTNQQGSFDFLVEKLGKETILGQIIEQVKAAQGSKAPVQRLTDRIAMIFVPVVLVLALITFLSWWILGGANGFTLGLLNGITVLIIACPCALGLATPTAIMVGVGKGAEHQILIKDAESLESAQEIDVVLLDKTGTITEGKPAVVDSWWSDKSEQNQQVLLELEKRSDHPLSIAIREELQNILDVGIIIDSFENQTGRGVMATWNNQVVKIGNEQFVALQESNLSVDLHEQLAVWKEQGFTVVFFQISDRLVAAFAIADRVKETSKEAIRQLQSSGIEVVMLTGDQFSAAQKIAREVGIQKVFAGLLPNDKAEIIRQLQAKGKKVAMIGDGINDSQALALADLSIAMGKGADIAMNVAKMTLISSDLLLVPKALKLARKTVAGIKQNLFWAFIYNVIGIPLAAGVMYPVNGFLLNPMIGGAAMALSSVSVVMNSLRLKYIRL